MLIVLWSLTHRYEDIGGDAELYAVQALAKIHPSLRGDLFLRNTSQDSYTLFSSLYAGWIGLVGLSLAALSLALAFKVWFFAAAWTLASDLWDRRIAFLSVAVLVLTTGAYGAYGVFHFAEDWLTARSLAEPLVLTSLIAHFRGARLVGLLITCGALLVHPLVAIAGLLSLLSMWISPRASATATAAGVLLLLGLSLDAVRPSSSLHHWVMDCDWLQVVRERSQFLFLQLWRAADWKQNASPFLSLTLSAIVLEDPRVRRLCISVMLIGAAGLAVALIGSLVGPLTLLLQGQAWRWMWLTSFAGALLVAPTVFGLARRGSSGVLCALLMIGAWTISEIDGTVCLACALLCWLLRDRIGARAERYVYWLNCLLAAAVMVWVVDRCASLAGSRVAAGNGAAFPYVQAMLGVKALPMLIVWSFASWTAANRSAAALWVACALLFTVSVFVLPRSLRDRDPQGTAPQIEEFSDWRSVIPSDANVLVLPAHNSAKFAWFTLERPSYLTVNQSSGVVYSRATALEVRRRSEVLQPLMDPDWKLLSNMASAPPAQGGAALSARPITRDRLLEVCRDPQLNFIIAGEKVGFDPLRHERPGMFAGWYLYDCRRVMAGAPSA